MSILLIPGTKHRILDASPPAGTVRHHEATWYINDHAFIQDRSDQWHIFGIWHPEPANPLDETFFLHASSPSLERPQWVFHPPVIQARIHLGETHVWAPHVVFHEDLYWMFYCGGTVDHHAYRICYATSRDLFTWDRPDENILFEDGYDARDPMLLRTVDGWLMFYTRTETPSGGHHQVAVRESSDLLHWSAPQVAYQSQKSGTYGGPTESPFVVPVDSGYLLFVCDAEAYDRTLVYFSTTPLSFCDSHRLSIDLDEHCAEVIPTLVSGEYWISGAGWGHGGVSLRRLQITTSNPPS